jgi:murein DD-endopeptidase MepM/ murein hydrolase activator NlpD
VKDDRFLIKIIPPRGDGVYRLHISRRTALSAAVTALLFVLALLGLHSWQLDTAEANVQALQAQAAAQRAHLGDMDRQAEGLANQLRALQRQNAAIQRAMGIRTPSDPNARPIHAERPAAPPTVAVVEARLRRLASASQAATVDEGRLARLTRRVLDLRRLAVLARVRLIAALPSINPVDGGIASGFGWRSNPWHEFHEGVDLEADYGQPVHAAADGVVVSAGWDPGGFGIKVDVDHGNGYHTWYAHLSRVAVAPG